MSISNEELIQLIEKSIIGTTTGGQLSPQQATDFVNLVIDQTPILNEMRVETGIKKSLTVDGLEFGDPVVYAGMEGTAPNANDVAAVDMPRLTLTPKEIHAAIDVSFSFLRKNVQEQNAEESINRAIAKRVGMDLVNLIFNGDTALDTTTKQNRALRIFDGILKKATADADVNDIVVAVAPVWSGDGSEFSKALRAIPKQYRDDRSMLRHFVSVDTIDDYEDEISERQTAAADNILFGANAVTMHKRVKIVPAFGFPNATLLTSVMSNLVLGFGLNMEMYRENKYREQKLELTMVTELDAGYIFGEAIALGKQA